MKSPTIIPTLILTLSGVVGLSQAHAQVSPLGGDFLVNTYTTGSQNNPAVASFGDGGFVVAWDSQDDGQTGTVQEIVARIYDGNGAAVTNEFVVNEFTTGNQSFASASGSPTAGFVIAWQSFGQDGPIQSSAVIARRFDASGLPVGSEFIVNGYTTGRQARPNVRMAASGEFVAVWVSGSSGGTQDGDREGVFGRKYNALGLPIGTEFQANQFTTGTQAVPSVAINSEGEFLVSWENGFLSGGDGDGSGIFARVFDTNAASIGTEFRVNVVTASEQRRPSATAAADGSFLVTWESLGQDGDGTGLYARKFAASGAAQGEEQLINEFTTGMQFQPVVSPSGAGGFIVAWQEVGDDQSSVLYARGLDESGTPQAGDFKVSSGNGTYLFNQSVAALDGIGFVIAWQEDGLDGDAGTIGARRFGTGVGNEICGDTNGDLNITASDAFFALQAAVGIQVCDLCRCDVSGDGFIRAGDALSLLRAGVGQPVVFNCPPCT